MSVARRGGFSSPGNLSGCAQQLGVVMVPPDRNSYTSTLLLAGLSVDCTCPAISCVHDLHRVAFEEAVCHRHRTT